MELRSKIYDVAVTCAEKQAAGSATMPEDIRRMRMLRRALSFLPAIHQAGAVTHEKTGRHYSIKVSRAFGSNYISVNEREIDLLGE